GYFIATVDLFLNLFPFSSRNENDFGFNVNIRELIKTAPFDLVKGSKSELFGFEEFNADQILSHLEKYFIGTYPALAQCFVLRKTAQINPA
ncbi:MAG TPA: SAM-dependent methyltransferase, partial [Gammaproteobacteria bacterium]|nr:SAM-dependent methyltransferase [Gammaproteobacteria bacterium]